MCGCHVGCILQFPVLLGGVRGLRSVPLLGAIHRGGAMLTDEEVMVDSLGPQGGFYMFYSYYQYLTVVSFLVKTVTIYDYILL